MGRCYSERFDKLSPEQDKLLRAFMALAPAVPGTRFASPVVQLKGPRLMGTPRLPGFETDPDVRVVRWLCDHDFLESVPIDVSGMYYALTWHGRGYIEGYDEQQAKRKKKSLAVPDDVLFDCN